MTELANNVRTLADRFNWLVDRSHAGSVNALAKAVGLPQPTLARIGRGIVTNPRTRILQGLSAYYGVTVDWLLTGKGDAPDSEAMFYRFQAERVHADMRALLKRYPAEWVQLALDNCTADGNTGSKKPLPTPAPFPNARTPATFNV